MRTRLFPRISLRVRRKRLGASTHFPASLSPKAPTHVSPSLLPSFLLPSSYPIHPPLPHQLMRSHATCMYTRPSCIAMAFAFTTSCIIA